MTISMRALLMAFGVLFLLAAFDMFVFALSGTFASLSDEPLSGYWLNSILLAVAGLALFRLPLPRPSSSRQRDVVYAMALSYAGRAIFFLTALGIIFLSLEFLARGAPQHSLLVYAFGALHITLGLYLGAAGSRLRHELETAGL